MGAFLLQSKVIKTLLSCFLLGTEEEVLEKAENCRSKVPVEKELFSNSDSDGEIIMNKKKYWKLIL